VNERTQLGWIARRFGFGLVPGQLDEWERVGIDGVIDQLVDGDAHGVTPVPDPFVGLERRPENPGQGIREATTAWLIDAVGSPRPFETWVTFFWHDYFAVAAPMVRSAGFIHDHFTLMASGGLANFRNLLEDMTVDAAMLVFLDGTQSTGASPNENYGRELLELYSTGFGEFTEDDVRAAAIALTGWVARIRFDEVRFVARRHDDSPQTLLGISGVHDVETVIEAVTQHPATARRVAAKVATAVLGNNADVGVIARHAAGFAENLELRPLFRGLIEDALDGAAQPVLIEPVPWFVSCLKATGAAPRGRGLVRSFEAAGQIPLNPPNVGGFPNQTSYLSTAATIGRFNIASTIASTIPRDAALLDAAEQHDLDVVADALGLGEFSRSTTEALSEVRGGVDVLAAVLASPDLIVA
jgi:uncharacterized protein (DUF1800 family)